MPSTGILAGNQRTEANRARDVYRHPKETLLFFGIRPEMSVLEVWPEPGWYTEIIAPLLRDKGKYYAGVIAADPGNAHITQRLDDYRAEARLPPGSLRPRAGGDLPARWERCRAAGIARHGGDLPQHP